MSEKEYIYKEFLRKEENILRAPYNPELEFYSVIKSGDVNKVKELCKESFTSKQGLGTLSKNPLQNIKYHFAITTAIIARYCIDGGLDVSTSYSLSDFYIQKADKSTSLSEIDQLHLKLCTDYATRMHNLRNHKICSVHIVRCIDYIQDNLHTKIMVDDLSNHVNLSTSYLSRLFKQETGYSINEYIRQTKLEAAKNMLTYSDFSVSEIASILAFSDQSYFTEIFRKYTGVTPKKYKNQHLREISLEEQ